MVFYIISSQQASYLLGPMIHTCQVTLDISGSPIIGASGNIQGNLTGMRWPGCCGILRVLRWALGIHCAWDDLIANQSRPTASLVTVYCLDVPQRYTHTGWVIMYITKMRTTWWRHQMEAFSALLALSAGNPPVPGEFPAQRPVTESLDVFIDLHLNKRLNKQSWGWWFEMPSRPLWRLSKCNGEWLLSYKYVN